MDTDWLARFLRGLPFPPVGNVGLGAQAAVTFPLATDQYLSWWIRSSIVGMEDKGCFRCHLLSL